MKRVLALDLESTGLDLNKDRITEIGLILWDIEAKKPLCLSSEYLWTPQLPTYITAENAELTGITPEMLAEFGVHPTTAINHFLMICREHSVEALVAHNGLGFDKPLLLNEMKRFGYPDKDIVYVDNLPMIDTKCHLPLKYKPDSTKLKYMGCDHGFLNPFQHRALFDVASMMQIFSQYDIKEIVEEMKAPRLVVRAMVPAPWTDNGVGKDKARKNGYSWENVDKFKFDKAWVKKIRADKYNEEQKLMEGYEVAIVLRGV